MGNHLSQSQGLEPVHSLPDSEQFGDPAESWKTFQEYIDKLNRLLRENFVFVKANFPSVQQITICSQLPESNFIPSGIQKLFFAAGASVKVTIQKQAAETVRVFATVKEFLSAMRNVDELLGFLKSVNREFRSKLMAQLDEVQDEWNVCGICFVAKMELVLACGHAFCEGCISQWKQKQSTCPMCRQDNVADDSDMLLVESGTLQETAQLRAELMQRLRVLIGELIGEEAAVAVADEGVPSMQ